VQPCLTCAGDERGLAQLTVDDYGKVELVAFSDGAGFVPLHHMAREPVCQRFVYRLVNPPLALRIAPGTEGDEEEGPEVSAAEFSQEFDFGV
jgi:hypothetical protein